MNKEILKEKISKHGWRLLWRIPRFVVFRIYGFLKMRWIVFYTPIRNRKIVEKIRQKPTLKVLFLPATLSMWKFDALFEKLREHPRFDPMILISLPKSLSPREREIERERMIEHFSAKNFTIVPENSAGTLNPDLVFITQGYGGFADFDLRDFPNALACYSDYSYPTSATPATMNLPNLIRLWKNFEPSHARKADCEKFMSNRGNNVCVTGYANADYFLDKTRKFAFPWKENVPAKKKIIYAPHWTIPGKSLLPYGTFLEFGEVILELAKKYSTQTQWCFKPHPWLFRTLCNLPNWGEKRAREYYDAWKNLPNATCELGCYIDLFMTSDAMIHDCGSFRCEYFYAQKPAMYLVANNDPTEKDGKVGKIAFNAHYHGRSREEIEAFIVETVLGGNDPKARERQAFFDKYLLPPNGKTAAQNIIDEIERGLNWNQK